MLCPTTAATLNKTQVSFTVNSSASFIKFWFKLKSAVHVHGNSKVISKFDFPLLSPTRLYLEMLNSGKWVPKPAGIQSWETSSEAYLSVWPSRVAFHYDKGVLYDRQTVGKIKMANILKSPVLTSNNSTFCPHDVFVFLCESQTATPVRCDINWLGFITET
jgi:hypothetical protein